MKLKLKISMKILAAIKKCLILEINSKYYDDSKKLVIGKMKDETRGIAIAEYVGLKSKMYYSFLVDDNSEHKKAKGVNKNVVGTKSHDKYKDVLLNKKCLRQFNE